MEEFEFALHQGVGKAEQLFAFPVRVQIAPHNVANFPVLDMTKMCVYYYLDEANKIVTVNTVRLLPVLCSTILQTIGGIGEQTDAYVQLLARSMNTLNTEFFHDVITPVSLLVSFPRFLSLITCLSLHLVVLGCSCYEHFLKYTILVSMFVSCASLAAFPKAAPAVDRSVPLATESQTPSR